MSILIIGGTKEERRQKALEIAKDKYRVSSFDTTLIEGITSIGIGQIRELEHNLSLKPYNSPAKAAIIHPAELLTIEAQNALLKTLEETGEHTIIILTAPQTDLLLPTVVSRCQIIKLANKPEIVLSEEVFKANYQLLTTIYQSGVGERLKIASQIGKDKETINEWVVTMIYVCRKILITSKGVSRNSHAELACLAARRVSASLSMNQDKSFTTSNVINLIKSLEKTRKLLEQNVNPRLVLEVFLLDLPLIS